MHREVQATRDRADRIFRQARLSKGAANAELRAGLPPRTMVQRRAPVVGIRPIHDMAVPTLERDGGEPRKKFLFAEKAAVRRIIDVFWIFEFMRFDDLVTRAELRRECRSRFD